jgi:hypothetical protein
LPQDTLKSDFLKIIFLHGAKYMSFHHSSFALDTLKVDFLTIIFFHGEIFEFS